MSNFQTKLIVSTSFPSKSELKNETRYFKTKFNSSCATFIPKISSTSIEIEKYTGEYEVTPKAHDEQILNTQGKLMTKDVTIHKIPYYQTSNLYGDTIYIASEVN